MYSLYRAWLSLNPSNGLPPLSVPPVPLNLSVPSSGQIPDAPDVTLQVGPSMTHFSAHRGVLSAHSGYFKAALANHGGLTPISVPNVNVDEFSSLLTFMYTGYLDLNLTNIYSILLATHILHMPRALELCRSFLLQQGPHTSEVQQQKVHVIKPVASRKMTPSMQEFFTPASYGELPKSVNTPFRAVKEELSLGLSRASTSKEEPKEVGRSPTSSVKDKKAIASKSSSKRRIEATSIKDKVIIDVACCDGPVRFHRVINKNYGLQNEENFDVSSSQQSYSSADFNRTTAMNKAMNENIMEKLNSTEDSQPSEVFTCVYCNHTFKSQYCYQKHARRHLYPVSVDKGAQAEAKREVKLLDMNVQYYPCKTCGSKFPSYYFVHKHRKMCHAEEVADKNHKNNEIVVETAMTGEESSSCSAIDVEAVQNEHEQQVT